MSVISHDITSRYLACDMIRTIRWKYARVYVSYLLKLFLPHFEANDYPSALLQRTSSSHDGWSHSQASPGVAPLPVSRSFTHSVTSGHDCKAGDEPSPLRSWQLTDSRAPSPQVAGGISERSNKVAGDNTSWLSGHPKASNMSWCGRRWYILVAAYLAAVNLASD
jgi:hypothetical protein